MRDYEKRVDDTAAGDAPRKRRRRIFKPQVVFVVILVCYFSVGAISRGFSSKGAWDYLFPDDPADSLPVGRVYAKGEIPVLIDLDYDGPALSTVLKSLPESGSETTAEDGVQVWFWVRERFTDTLGNTTEYLWYGGDQNPESKDAFFHGYIVAKREDGSLSRVSSVRHGRSNGVQELYSSDGAYMQRRFFTKDGRMDGPATDYFDNGDVKNVVHWKNDCQHGEFTHYRQDGTIEKTGAYDLGDEHGEWETFHTDGKTAASRKFYDFGHPIGVWKFYRPDGSVEREENHDS
ncbi:hypothetical protein OAU50_07525 [Planctomycetota bacterium]|nr:hypothetical protein [Planctomycetota bacterium]